MTKAELVDEVGREASLTRKHSEVIVDAVFSSIVEALQRGDKIELRGFGSFRIRRRGTPHRAQPEDRRGCRRPGQDGAVLQAGQGAARADQPGLTRMSASLYLKDPAASRFVAGGIAEVEDLFGSPLPDLPAPRARRRAQRLPRARPLPAALAAAALPRGAARADRRDHAARRRPRPRLLRVRGGARARGALGAPGRPPAGAAQPVLAGAQPPLGRAPAHASRRAARRCAVPSSRCSRCCSPSTGASTRTAVAPARARPWPAARTRRWSRRSSTTASPSASSRSPSSTCRTSSRPNKRYRIPPEVFFEIQQVLVREAERRLREGDRGLLARCARHLPALSRESYLRPGSLLQHRDERAGADLPAGRPVDDRAAPRRRARRCGPRPSGGAGPEVLDAYLELTAVGAALRDRVAPARACGLAGGSSARSELEEKTRRGLRVYEFGESAEVLNNAVSATVLFLDLRGFTRTSEGHISERDLTRELYAVFDDFVPIVERFGGTVDKYLGDGMMVAWGTERADPLDPLNALRTAILCQESLARKRQEGRTWFKMGDRHPPRPGLPGALHRGRRRRAHHGDRPQREPGRAALLGGEEAARGGRLRRPGRGAADHRPRRQRRPGRRAVQRGDRDQPRHAGAAREPPRAGARPGCDGVRGRGDRPAHPDPLRRETRSSRACARACRCTRSATSREASVERLFTPWRMAYVTPGGPACPGCVLCRARDGRGRRRAAGRAPGCRTTSW